MKRFSTVAALVAAFFCASALASTGVATVTYTAPTVYSDGSALAASALTAFEAECMQSAPGGTLAPCAVPLVQAAGTARSIPVTVTFAAGVGARVCLRVRAYAGGPAGAWNAQGCKDIDPVAPGAPGAITITIVITVSP